jgi:RHS repeat-associated protein
MAFSRYYNSQSNLNTTCGNGWTTTYTDFLTFQTGKAILRQADGAEVHFIDNGQGKFISETDKVRVIEPVAGGYGLQELDGGMLSFGTDGKLLRISDRNGNTQTLTYSSGRLASVEDTFGRRLEFTYGPSGKLATLNTPIGPFVYSYDSSENLTIVSLPDQTTKTYLYQDRFDSHNLTGIINEKGIRSLTVQYDEQDRAVLSEGPGGIKRVSIVYADEFVRHVTDSLGRTTTFKLHVDRGIGRIKEVSGEGCGSCLGSIGEKYEFDDRLYVTQETDALGVVTTYTYDERGNVLTKTEAVGFPEERTTAYTYHPTFDLVTSITRSSVANPGQSTTTVFTYDERGNLLIRTESGFDRSGAVTRSTTYTYNSHGQLTSVDGPRTDLSDVTTLEYYPNTPDQGLNRGRLRKVTDPMGFETTFGQYNAFGKPGTGTDQNNVTTTYTYDSMGRLKTRIVDGLTTTFSYDEAGGLVFSRYPDGREFTYDYTDSGWLEKIMALPGAINYLYDTEGNRTGEEIRDGEGTVLRYTRFEYDDKNRLHKTVFPDSHFEERAYDLKGSLVEIKDQKGQSTTYGYDVLSRLTSVTQPGSVITGYAYDNLDNLIRVTDAENHATIYTYDDLGRLLSTLSPDTSLTAYTYDPAGNLLSKADANSVTASYTYDTLNRLTRISYPDSSQDVVFSYDQGVNGKGRLTGMIDPSGTYTYAYDAFGNLVTETRATGGITFTTKYSYSQGGPLQSITYPSGRVVSYERDSAGRVIRVKDTVGGTTRTLGENISYLPFGPLKELTYGNGVGETRGFDEMFRLTGLSAGSVMNLSYTHDPVGNILTITNLLDPTRSQSFTYDSLERLVGAQGVYGTEGYTYDRVGKRLQKARNEEVEDYSYISGTNKIQAITGASPLSFSYDQNGNTTQMGEQGFAYNQDNRLVQASLRDATVGSYTYNGKGERTRKIADGKTTLYIWDKDGNLIGEADESGATLREYVYLEGKLLSLISSEPPKDIEVRVTTSKGRRLTNINVYAFTQAGAYTGKTARTDAQGLAVFQNGLLADGNYKFRADYLSYQFWSPVIGVPGGNTAEVAIEEETAALTVTVAGESKPGVKVYLFNGSGSYLGLYQTSDAQGKVFFDLPVGKTFKFRADYLGSQYWSSIVTIQGGVQNTISLATGGGSLTVTLKKDADNAIPEARLYLFSLAGSYLGLFGTGDENGVVSYTVSGGSYKVRADYLGYQFWSDVIGVSGSSQLAFTIPHEDVEITVEGESAGLREPKTDVPGYLFTSSGMYVNVNARTNAEGKLVFSLPQKEYKVRADYLGAQFWSEVFNWEDKTLSINEGMADVTVTNMGLPLQGVPVYAFTATGSYLSLNRVTDVMGRVSFRLPEGRYKFRADYLGSQYWSGDTVLIPHVANPIPISTGGGVFTLRVEKTPGVPLVGASCYLFSGSGAYLSQQVLTNGQGEAGFNLADGSYKIRADYLGYQYWTSVFTVPGAASLTHSIPHQDVTVTVRGDYNGDVQPKSEINLYLFTSSGAYVNVSRLTDHEGHVVFSVPPGDYKVRADYLGAQYWSEVFNQAGRQVVINDGLADVFVNQNGSAVGNVNVYVFSASGSYLNLHGTTGSNGVASFRLPEGTYRFRADYQGSQFWVTEAVPAHQVKSVNLDTGGGLFTLRVEKAPAVALADKPVYVFTPSGSYLNMTAETNEQGEVSFALASGWYRFRVDYLGYHFWCDSLEVPSTLSHTMSIPHRETTISVNTFYTGAMAPLENANVYLFTDTGSYLNLNASTNAAGQVKFNVPDQEYRVRVDYLGGHYWSEVLRWQDKEVVIDEGMVDLHVTWNGADVTGAPVYLFTDTGSYLNRTIATDAQGHARFTVPVNPFRFRIDYNGRQYWTPAITPIAHQPLSIEVPLEQLALAPTNNPRPSRYDGEAPIFVGEPVKVASIGSLMGLLSQSVVALTAQPKVYYYLTDHLGTPQKLIDATGAVVWSGDYKPFGEVLSTVSTIQNPFRFSGQYFDQETALHYNYHRYYHPRYGSYITPDPIGLDAGINLFQYVQNNPVRFIDLDGLRHLEWMDLDPIAWPFEANSMRRHMRWHSLDRYKEGMKVCDDLYALAVRQCSQKRETGDCSAFAKCSENSKRFYESCQKSQGQWKKLSDEYGYLKGWLDFKRFTEQEAEQHYEKQFQTSREEMEALLFRYLNQN